MEPAFSQRLIECLSYNPDTGIITGPVTIKSYKGNDYDYVVFEGRYEQAANVAWLLHHGEWPPKGYIVDHKNRIKKDNRLANLRLATHVQNMQNKAGYGSHAKGVSYRHDRSRQKPFQARIRVNGIRILLGSFETEEEAAEAYRQAALRYHGEFACLS